MRKSVWILPVLVLLLFSGRYCAKTTGEVKDFPRIVELDTLRVLTLNSSTSYFIYRDQPMGYHYDMINSFCVEHGIVPKIIVAANLNHLFEMLQNGVGDMIAYNMPYSNEYKDSAIYAGLQQVSHQVLVQPLRPIDSLLTDVTHLIGRNITVIDGSKQYERLVNLNNELGGGIIIEKEKSDSVVVEDLIRMVSRGEIDYTVADDDLAKFNQTYFRNIDVHLGVSFEQRSSWMVSKESPILADSLNSWFANRRSTPANLRIIKRYFEEAKGYSLPGQPFVGSIIGAGVISPFDLYFRKYGDAIAVDWRLLASIAYQESTFDSDGLSWAGARGLMGLMPATAASLGVEADELYDPEINIRTGAEYLKTLLNIFRTIDDSNERLQIVLAAYNGGIGHIFDARALAKKYGADEDIWYSNVEKYIHLKHLEHYYNDPVCNNGYFRGEETINYVSNVISRWEFYKQKVKE